MKSVTIGYLINNVIENGVLEIKQNKKHFFFLLLFVNGESKIAANEKNFKCLKLTNV